MRGSIQRRGTNTWRLVFDVGRDASGKRCQKTSTVHGTKKAAQAALTQVLAKHANGGFIDPGNLTVGEFLLRWLDHVVPTTTAKTHERYEEICRNNLIVGLGRLKLSELRNDQIDQFYAELLKSGRKNRPGGLSARTVLHIHRVLFQALKQATIWKLRSDNPAATASPPKPSEKEMVVPDDDDAASLLHATEESWLHIPVLLAVSTGVRRGEALALRWSDIDFEYGSLWVRRSLSKTRSSGLQFKAPKTKRGRRQIPIPEFAISALRQHMRIQKEESLRLGCGWNLDRLVCSDPHGDAINPNTLTSAFASFVKKSGIRPMRYHDLRHLHATQLFKLGIHPKIVQERLGHSTIAVTLDLYSHVLPGMQEDATSKLDKAWQSALGKRPENKH